MIYREDFETARSSSTRSPNRFWREASSWLLTPISTFRIESLLRWLNTSSPWQIRPPSPSLLKLRKSSKDPSIQSFQALQTRDACIREGALQKDKSIRKRSRETLLKRLLSSFDLAYTSWWKSSRRVSKAASFEERVSSYPSFRWCKTSSRWTYIEMMAQIGSLHGMSLSSWANEIDVEW